jgi:hypothetical protein
VGTTHLYKKDEPPLEIKFSRGLGQQVKEFLLCWKIDLKIVALKQLIGKFLNRLVVHI